MKSYLSTVLRCSILLALPILATPTSLHATVPFDGFVGIASDYVFRGISQNRGDAALQAEANLRWKSLSFQIWGSNIDYGNDSNARAELDFSIAWTYEVDHQTSFEAGTIRYVYTGERQSDYSEAYFGLNVGRWSGRYYLAPKYSGTAVKAHYFDLRYTFATRTGTELVLQAGRNLFRGEPIGEERTPYWDFSLSVRRSFQSWDLEVVFWETDLETDQMVSPVVAKIKRRF